MAQALNISYATADQEDQSNLFAALVNIFEKVISSSAPGKERTEGAAFLRAAKDLYGISGVLYFCINISLHGRTTFAHCLYSDTAVRHVVGPRCSDPEMMAQLGALARCEETYSSSDIALPLQQQQDEVAILGVRLASPLQSPDPYGHRQSILRELRVLGNYFHGHNLRINGHDGSNEIIMSARELDCLKWAAVGKTAWEASVILGISERTVRFHLNAAREKLGCLTTTQAVAKAVAHRIIEI